MKKKWNIHVIGTIASDVSVQHALGRDAVGKNPEGGLQFYIRMISKVPGSFPKQIKLLTCDGAELEKWGFEGNEHSLHEGKKEIYPFLSDNLILCKPQKNDFYEYEGKEIILLPKSENYHAGVHLSPMPIFSAEEQGISQIEFEERLLMQQSVGDVLNFSREKNDAIPYVIWKNSDSDYRLYGEFSDHHFDGNGFSFTSNKPIQSTRLVDEWLDDCYEYEHTLFVPNEIVNQMDEALAFAQPVNRTNEKEIKTTVEAPSLAVGENRVEEDILQYFIKTTQDEGLLYDNQDLYNFHTSMKSSNLVILAGMSGTGKSKMVKAYAKALGLDESYQLAYIPVRPSWTDDADLIGYADTHHKVYRPADSGVVNALLSAKENPSLMHIICFDEMNLARVEHYFSQFLSVLEMEAGPSRVLRLYNDNLKDELTNSSLYPPVIPIGDNVLFVGTVNLDESTYHFSDKVLDRANVITLNVLPFSSLKGNKEKLGDTGSNERRAVSFPMYDSFRNKNQEIQMEEKELEFLWDVHTQLQRMNKNLGVGPRIVRQIDQYLKNLPDGKDFTRKEAFDKQVVQRILTKVRGPEDQLKSLIGSYDKHTENLDDSMLAEILDRYHEVSEFYETRNVLIHKAKELKLNGYTL